MPVMVTCLGLHVCPPSCKGGQQIGIDTFESLVNLDMPVSFRKPLETGVPLHGFEPRIGNRGTCRSKALAFLFALGRPL